MFHPVAHEQPVQPLSFAAMKHQGTKLGQACPAAGGP
jgi:hypothetical protein